MAEIRFYFLVLSAIGFDLLVGDPSFFLHPVEIMGFYIKKITDFFINYSKGNYNLLLLGGFLVAISTITLSFYAGKYFEILFYQSEGNLIFGLIIFFGLSSCLAFKSLISIVKDISYSIKKNYTNKDSTRVILDKVQKIVSRNVSKSSIEDLLRSSTESLTENAVDGIFAPLFWIFLGTFLMKFSIYLPGPLSLGLSYKAISTLDSMIGYKYNSYKYIGFFSAKIEDYATFIPCRLVAITLPIVSKEVRNYFYIIKKVFHEGNKYESPNSGISEASFAYLTNIKLGGINEYPEGLVKKPIINSDGENITSHSINKICGLILRLQILWVLIFSLTIYLINKF